jgi:hypothetical protein
MIFSTLFTIRIPWKVIKVVDEMIKTFEETNKIVEAVDWVQSVTRESKLEKLVKTTTAHEDSRATEMHHEVC